MIGGASVRYRTNAELFFIAPVARAASAPDLRPSQSPRRERAPFDRDQAGRARIKFIETPVLIDAIGGEHAGPAAAA
jgi:hypothetical protein